MTRGRPVPDTFIGRLVATLLAGVVALPGTLTAQEPPPVQEPEAWSLGRVVERVLAVNPLVEAHQLDVRRAQVDLDQLHDFWSLPEVNLTGFTGVVPEARGDIFESPDTSSDLDGLGPFFRSELSLAVPIVTFGRLGAARGAAGSTVDARRAQLDRGRDEIALQTIQTYWGMVAAGQTVEMSDDMLSAYDELIAEAEAKDESAEIDANDLWEIRTARYDLDVVAAEAAEARRTTGLALRRLLELPEGALLELRDREPPVIEIDRDDLDAFQTRARAQHPQLRALRSAVAALDSAMRLESANRWPLVLIGGGLGIARSSARDDQKNPFAYDEFNFNRLGVAVNVRWDLNFARHGVNRARRRIERDATEARAAALGIKVDLEVAQKLEKLLKNVELLESAEVSRRNASRWVRAAGDDFDLGLGEAQPLIRAFRADYRLQAEAVGRQYLVNVSLAELALATGDLHSYLQWVVDGRAALATSRSADGSPGVGGGRPGRR